VALKLGAGQCAQPRDQGNGEAIKRTILALAITSLSVIGFAASFLLLKAGGRR
jgi:hypothetical protein